MSIQQTCRAYLAFIILIPGVINGITSQPAIINTICYNPSNDSNFITNLTSLLDSLSSKASVNSFYKDTSTGVYGLFLCRGDVSSKTCQNCVSTASKRIRSECSSNGSAIIWYDECMLRYSEDSFFGVAQLSPRVLMWNTGNRTSPDQVDIDALSLLYTLTKDASKTDMLFKTGDSSVGNLGQHAYGLVQCTIDINSSSCSSCLVELITEAQQCCQRKIGWRILAPSCSIRYETYRFFQKTLPPPVLVPMAPEPTPDGKEGEGGKNITKIIIITVIPITVVAALACILYYSLSRRKRRQTEEVTSEEIRLWNLETSHFRYMTEDSKDARNQDNSGEMQHFNLSTIQAATNNFSDENKLGEGGFGPVYKGKLISGQEIAVKRLSFSSRQGLEEFKNEVMLVVKLQHKNLVRLLGCCLEGNEKLLVYEYMPNTSLDAFLFDPTKHRELDWDKRANIIKGIARGLLYLHEDSRLKIIHRDMKASNVLLDNEMNPKISDFGTARIFGGNQIEANTDKVVGTYGYMAPEYALEGLFSIKSDVYSFGVLMLEIISGRKNSGFYNPDRAQSLLSYAWRLWNEGRGLEVLDPDLVNFCPTEEAVRWIHVGLLCIQEDPDHRPTMSSVVLMLGGSATNLPQPFAPPFSVGRFFGSDQSSTTGEGIEFLTSDQSTTSASS
ncbi:Cysteine rich receptor like kinase [Quillaja saponaria]|uniref:non-specific serine/threonine protein kinase n=1 Tax=Quillaja saponaria TaxID=32244 RepID=A0AAD7P928_QUISA|nr:Cysteine rich receptor like kinase [Quillaja saponaria]